MFDTNTGMGMDKLLTELSRLGIKLQLHGDELQISAPHGALTPHLRGTLKEFKPRLVDMLRGQRSAAEEAARITHDESARFEPFALTELQHAYWLGRDAALDMGSVATHLYVELDCPDLDLPRANEALCTLIDRHDMLRAVVGPDGMQRVLREVPRYQIAAGNHRSATDAEAETAALVVRDELSHQVLKADRWPLFDVRATLMPHDRVRLHISLDLLILDAWSIFLLFREWHQVYEQPEQPAAALGIGFRDYVQADIQRREMPAYQEAREYWSRRLDTLPPAPDLPLRADPAARRAPRFVRREARLDQARWAKLKRVAQGHGLTPSGLLLAVYSEVLTRWSASAHFTLNVTIGKRREVHPDVHRLLGDFTTLVLQEVDRRDTSATFLEFANTLQRQFLQDVENSDYSGLSVLREWAKRRGLPMQALMPVVFSSGLIWSGDQEVGNLEQFGTKVYSISQTSQVWLDHHVMELDGDLVLIWDAADAVFEPGVLDAMFGAYCRAIDQLSDDQSTWSSTSLVALPADMQKRREQLNRTEQDWPRQALHAGFVARALKTPQAIAVEAVGRSISYRQLLQEAAAVADWLKAHDVSPGRPVAVLMRKGWEQVVAVLGTLLAGAAYLPIDADLPTKRQAELLRLGEVEHVLTQPGVLRAEINALPESASRAWHEVRAGHAAVYSDHHDRSLQAVQDQLAYVIFTSGTTGMPKGVMIDHRGASNTVHFINQLMGISEQDRVLAVSSLSFDLSVYDIFGVLGAGGTLVIPDAGKGHDPLHWRDLIEKHDVSLWNSAPQLMRMLMDSYQPEDGNSPTLRTVLLSGDFIPLDLPSRVRVRHPLARVVSLGGATEASIWSNYYPINTVAPTWKSIPYGHALPNQTIWVYDQAMRPCPDHAKGRIYIGGIGLAMGYWRDEAKTAARFVTHPQTGERLYDTGDLGRYAADGEIIILGRDDGQVKIRGHRVELGEIEAVLGRHSSVRHAVVVATGAGSDNRQIVAYVEPEEHAAVDAAQLKAYLADALPDYMVPRHLMAIDSLPVTGNGKINYQALPPVQEDAEYAGEERVAPRDPIEQTILNIWKRVIVGLDIGVTDNFFELGGDSILATQLVRELNAEMDFGLEMHELFENLTVDALARLYERKQDVGDSGHSGHSDEHTHVHAVNAGIPTASGDPVTGVASVGSGASLALDAVLLADVEGAQAHIAALQLPYVQADYKQPHEVLLTGATGWLGSHVLHELLSSTTAHIRCLVRADHPGQALQRISEEWLAHDLGRMPAAWLTRIEPVCGRLDAPLLGLDLPQWQALRESVDVIYHFGASVNVLADYATHRRSNVMPMLTLVDLATQGGKLKAIVTASPMAVCRRHVEGRLIVLGDEQVHHDPSGLLTAYAQSKWMGEQILHAAARRGVPVAIYRCSHALPSARTGMGKTHDTYTQVLQIACAADAIPTWEHSSLYGVPSDVLAKLLVADVKRADLHASDSPLVAHIENREPMTMEQVITLLMSNKHGDASLVPKVSLQAWQTRCQQVLAEHHADSGALGHALFGVRAVGSAVENMFQSHPIDTDYFARTGQAEVLSSLTGAGYWSKVFEASLADHDHDSPSPEL